MTGGPFRVFLAARAVSWAGTAMTMVALPVLVFQRSGSAALTGLVAALEAVPYLVLGLPAGALVDRWDQRRTLVLTSLISAAAMASVPLAELAGALTTAHVLLAAVTVSSAFVFFDAAGFGVLPAIVGREGLSAATGTMMSVSTAISLVGPAVGGVGVAVAGAPAVLALDGASYLLAAVLLARVRVPARAPEADVAGGRWSRTRRDVAEGLRYLWRQPTIRTLTLLGVGNSLTAGAVTGLVVVVATRRLGLPDDDPRIGLLFAAAAAGTLAVSLALPRIHARWPVGTVTLAGLLANWLALLAWAATRDWRLALVVLAVLQAANTLVNVNGIVVRQALTPDRLQGRVNTTARMIAWGGTPFGALLGGVLADVAGVAAALLVMSLGVAVAFAAGRRTSLRRTGLLSELVAASADVPLSRTHP